MVKNVLGKIKNYKGKFEQAEDGCIFIYIQDIFNHVQNILKLVIGHLHSVFVITETYKLTYYVQKYVTLETNCMV